MSFIHTYNMYFFHVLILKVTTIYSEPSLVIIFKEFKCMCVSYIIINPWSSWIEIYEYFDEFINLCTYVDARCIFVSIRHKIWNIWRLWSWLLSSWCWRKEIVFKACIITWKLCNFFNWEINGIQVAMIFYLFISTCTLGSTLKISCWRELTKIVFILFECKIMLYMLTHVF
jgi:hypothetical protein